MHREDFPMLDKSIIYVDNGATTFKPKSVINAITEYYEDYSANAHRGDYDISYRVDVNYEHARENIANFINANKEEIVFTSGTTDSINMASNGFFKNILKKDDEILITLSEHASNVLPWFNLSNTNGVKVKFIPLDENLHVTIENVASSITNKTKLIAIAGTTNVVGDVRPMKGIIKIAHQHNIYVLIDGAQSVPHNKVDVKELDCDFLAFSGHKMCGPTGIGVLYGKKELLEKLYPVRRGGGMNESFDSYDEIYLKPVPTKFEAGTPNIAGAIGLSAAVDYLNSIGMENIHQEELRLKKYLVDKISQIPHIKIVNDSIESGVLAFNVEGVFAQDVAYYLNKYNICVRAGNHCAKLLKKAINEKNTVRISLYFYNTTEEIDKIVELLSDINKIKNEMI